MTESSQPQSRNLSSAEDFFLEVLKPNYELHCGSQWSFATTLNLAMSLFHFSEWLSHDFKSKLEMEEYFGTFGKKGTLWSKVEPTNPRFGYVRDVANASKHVEYSWSKPSTGVRDITMVRITDRPYGTGAYGQGRYGGPDVLCDDDGQQVYFDDCASELYDYWKELLERLTGKVYE